MVVTRAEWERLKFRSLKKRLKAQWRDGRYRLDAEPEPVKDKDLPVYAKDADNDG